MYTRNLDHCIEYVPNPPDFYDEEEQDEDYLIDKYLSDIESEDNYYNSLDGHTFK